MDKFYPEIGIILLNWNGRSIEFNSKSILELSLKSLLNLNYNKLKIIVVDASSDDDSVNWLKQFKDKITILKAKNIGWAHNNNVGIKYILKKFKECEFIILVSNDIIIKDKDIILKILRKIRYREDVGILGCKLINPPGSLKDPIIQNTGIRLNRYGGWSPVSHTNEGYLERNVYVIGAFMVIRKGCFLKYGLLSGDYIKMGSEDTDFADRIYKFGYKSFYVNCEVIHIGSISTRKTIKNKGWGKDKDKLEMYYYSNHFLYLLRYHKLKFILFTFYNTIRIFIGIKPNIRVKTLTEINKNYKELYYELKSAIGRFNKSV
jgi:GT2 family glycosyltransferase